MAKKNNKKEDVEEPEEVEEKQEEKTQPKVQVITPEQLIQFRFDEVNTGLAVLNQKLDKVISLAEEEE